MKYTTRLYVGFSLIIMVIAVLFGIIVGTVHNQNQDMNALYQDRYLKIQLLNHIRVGIKNIDQDLNNILQSPISIEDNRNLESIRVGMTEINEDLHKLDAIIKVKQAKEKLQLMQVQIEDFYQSINEIIARIEAGNIEKISSVYETALLQDNEIINTTESLISIQERIMEDTLKNSETSNNIYVKVTIVSIILTLLVCFWISRWVINNIKTRFRSIRDVMKSIQYGAENLPRLKDFSLDEIGEIAQAYNEMATALEAHERMERQYTEEVEEQNWLSMRLAELSMLAQEIFDIKNLDDKYFQAVIPMVDACYGALYILKNDRSRPYLLKVCSYTDEVFENPLSIVELEEGLVGQCAKDGRLRRIKSVQSLPHAFSSHMGKSAPNEILIFPIHLDGEIVGVLELATKSEFPQLHEKLLIEAMHQLGVTIDRIIQQMKVRKLLEESQALNEELRMQSEEMQFQQEQLRKMNEQLEIQYNHSEQKTRDLEATKLELEERTKQLQLTSKYKTEFLANISHELRTPLNSLLILAQILLENKENNLTEKQKEYANTIHAAGKDLLNLINDILDLAKIESGKIDIKRNEMEIGDMVSFITKQFEPLALRKNIEFEVEVANNIPGFVYTDTQKVYQILKNLLSNAIKFTVKGKVRVLVKRTINQQGDYIAFVVADTGIGISNENQELIFEAFQQVDGTTSRQYGGTGLGLSISKELAGLLSGFITVESEEGKGSTFTFYLPVNIEAEVVNTYHNVELDMFDLQQEVVEEPRIGSNIAPDHELTGKHVLIVDDDMRNIFSMTTVFEAMGMKVSFAENGLEGIQFLENNRDIDIILMDIMMAEMDGYETMREVRKNEQLKHIPIIAVTAKAMSEDRSKCIEAGASDYMTKPVNLEQLILLMKVWLCQLDTEIMEE